MKNLSKIKWLIAGVLLILQLAAFGSVKKLNRKDCMYKKNTICKSMLKLHPKMDHKKAYKLSNLFSRVAKKYKVNPKLLISIAYQESTFKPKTVRRVTGLVFNEETGEYKEVKVGEDFCMMQIHQSNIRKMKLDVAKLLKDPRYCLEAGAKILTKYKKKYSKTEKEWWTRYNAKSTAKRAIYFNHITRHLNKLSPKRVIASEKLIEKKEKGTAVITTTAIIKK
jgi:soluble lytic murein transglycosylase-like protein